MIYKYFDEQTLQPVEDRTLKFAQIKDLNDPFENLNRVEIIPDELNARLEVVAAELRQRPALAGLSPNDRERCISQALDQVRPQFDGSTDRRAELLQQQPRRVRRAGARLPAQKRVPAEPGGVKLDRTGLTSALAASATRHHIGGVS